MGGCCSSEPTCILTRSEIDPINAIALDSIIKSPVPLAAPFVAKFIRGKTKCQFSELASRLAKDTVPVNTIQADGLDATPFQQMRDPMRTLISMVVGQTFREAARSMTPAALNLVRGGNPNDATQRQRCAESALMKASENAVQAALEQLLNSKRQEIESFQSASFSPTSTMRAGSVAGNGRPIPGSAGAGAATGSVSPLSNNNNNNNNINNPNGNNSRGGFAPGPQNQQNQQQPFQQNSYGGAPQQQQQQQQQQQNSFATPQKSQQQQQQQPGGQNGAAAAAAAADSPIDHRHGYSGSQQQFYDSISKYEEQQQEHEGQDYASPTNEAWSRYPIPEQNGPWVPINEAFYWSENAELYYFPAAGHFFHPESAMWYDPASDQWMEEAAHEKLLENMAKQGLY